MWGSTSPNPAWSSPTGSWRELFETYQLPARKGSSGPRAGGSTVPVPTRPARRGPRLRGRGPLSRAPLLQGASMSYTGGDVQQLLGSARDAARFWSKVGPATTSGCYPWLGALNRGYGTFTIGRRAHGAHRFAYMLTHKVVLAADEHVDHLCRMTSCVNVDHLEAVPAKTDVLRGTGPTARYAANFCCPQGHPYDYVAPSGRRGCRRCRSESGRKYGVKRNAHRQATWIGRGR